MVAKGYKVMESKIIVQSTKWSAISEVLAKIVSPLANIVLARLLAPEVFGLVASFMVVTSFAEVFTDAGFQKYIVQHDFENKEHLYNYTTVAFWSNMIFSIAIWFVILLFRKSIATFIGSEGYGLEVAILALLIPIHALSSIQNALYRREFKFKQLVPIRFVASLVPVVVTIPCAYIFKSVWAIIIGNITKELLTAVMLTYNSLWKPKWFYKFSYLKDMLLDCIWLLGDSLMIWITGYASTFIVNRFLNPYYTGIYKTGSNTIQPYLTLVFAITSPVLFSALSRLQNDVEERNKVFFSYQKYASYIIIPLGIGVFVYRDLVTMILLGSAWEEAAILIGCNGLVFPFTVLTAQYNSVYYRAAGKANVAMLVQGLYNVVMIVILLLAVNQPFEILSIVGGCCTLAYCIISTVALQIVFKIRFLNTLLIFLPSLISSFAAVAISYIIMPFFGGAIWWHIVCASIAGVTYLFALICIPQSRNAITNTAAYKTIKSRLVK